MTFAMQMQFNYAKLHFERVSLKGWTLEYWCIQVIRVNCLIENKRAKRLNAHTL